ncbi:dethiobiotin synthase [Endozoicomonas sp. (ex Bugula neritina AB1)]|nr:dethiobiotin synthase [Endozoicomonas sp. (ex Bugula neritina AB1)]
MGKAYFVTGTDTDVGKTLITCGLLEAAGRQGLNTLALKPVAAGCDMTDEGLRNDDALKLMDAATIQLPYEQVNPFALRPPIAPHIAARDAGVRMTIDRLSGYCRGALMRKNDLAFIEGAGGWRVPLNDREFFSGLPKVMNLPVILVVGMKLGCINHTVLTVEAILRDGLTLAGWVANRIDADMSCYDENTQTLKSVIPAPCLGEVPWLQIADKGAAADYLDISFLI